MSDRFGGIFAAGEGSRLKESYPGLIKPMVPVAGRPLIEWTVRLLMSAGINDIVVLLNSKGGPAREHLKKAVPGARFVFLMKDTASSYESFRLVSQTIAGEADSFLLSTVDAFYEPASLRSFIASAEAGGADAVLGVTAEIEDEKPLWADLSGTGRIVALGEDCKVKKFATSGVYYMTAGVAQDMPPAGTYTALRQYLGGLVRGGATVNSALMPHSVDVDDAKDIELAEKFVREHLPA